MLKYAIHGAGAIGSAIGGSLARKGFEVTLVARPNHVLAIEKQNGIILETLEGEHLQPIRAGSSFPQVKEETVIFQTMKANDIEASLNDLNSADPSVPVICWQNGMGSEEIAGRRFKKVYGGVVRFTATMMTPGRVSFAGSGKLILGLFPQGMDVLCREIIRDLKGAGFEAIISEKIIQDKWLKVLVNLVSCIKPMTRKTQDEGLRRLHLCRKVLEEGIEVLRKAGIVAASTNGTEDSSEQMMANLDETLRLAEGRGQGMELQNSVWQSFAKHKKELEIDWYTGLIIKLAQEHGIAVPFNRAVLHFAHEIADHGTGPESIDIEKIFKRALRG